MRGLDAWITGGRYSSELLDVTCPACGEVTAVTCETEYGASMWSPEECGSCGEGFSGEESFEASEPPDMRDRWDED